MRVVSASCSRALALLTLTSCAGAPVSRSVAQPAPTPAASAPPLSPAPATTPAPRVATTPTNGPPAPHPCGGSDCLAFPTAQAAFAYVLKSQPRVLAIGEAHAQEG